MAALVVLTLRKPLALALQAMDLKIRDNEIRHYVDLLVLAGMPERMACNAIADAFTFTRKRINDINEQDLLDNGRTRRRRGTALSPPTYEVSS